jgi:hypothetical protein
MSGGGGMPAQGGGGSPQSQILARLLSGMGQQGGGQPPMGGMFSGPNVQMQPMGQVAPQGQGQYQASPAAASQIQSLLSGTAGGFGGAGGGLGGGMTTFGKYSGALTPGIQAAMGAGGSGVPGGGDNFSMGGGIAGGLLGGPIGALALGNLFKPNNSQIQDIAGALYQGLPITNADWQNAGFGPGGIPLGGQ